MARKKKQESTRYIIFNNGTRYRIDREEGRFFVCGDTRFFRYRKDFFIEVEGIEECAEDSSVDQKEEDNYANQ